MIYGLDFKVWIFMSLEKYKEKRSFDKGRKPDRRSHNFMGIASKPVHSPLSYTSRFDCLRHNSK